METYFDANSIERCAGCREELGYCTCVCDACSENVHECVCDDD